MKIGIFDSGLGGLFITKSITRRLPRYDYLYVGDTERSPYGNRSGRVVYQFLREAVAYLFKEDCALVIVACNTASAQALRRIQKEYLPQHYPGRRVLGIIVPTIEKVSANRAKRIGVLATAGTVRTRAFTRELRKSDTHMRVFEAAAPLLVPIIEHNEMRLANAAIRHYLAPLLKKKIDTLILGCTHYPIVRRRIKMFAGPSINVVSQDEFIGEKLADYLVRHPEIERMLTRRKRIALRVTDVTPAFRTLSRRWFGRSATLKRIHLL